MGIFGRSKKNKPDHDEPESQPEPQAKGARLGKGPAAGAAAKAGAKPLAPARPISGRKTAMPPGKGVGGKPPVAAKKGYIEPQSEELQPVEEDLGNLMEPEAAEVPDAQPVNFDDDLNADAVSATIYDVVDFGADSGSLGDAKAAEAEVPTIEDFSADSQMSESDGEGEAAAGGEDAIFDFDAGFEEAAAAEPAAEDVDVRSKELPSIDPNEAMAMFAGWGRKADAAPPAPAVNARGGIGDFKIEPDAASPKKPVMPPAPAAKPQPPMPVAKPAVPAAKPPLPVPAAKPAAPAPAAKVAPPAPPKPVPGQRAPSAIRLPMSKNAPPQETAAEDNAVDQFLAAAGIEENADPLGIHSAPTMAMDNAGMMFEESAEALNITAPMSLEESAPLAEENVMERLGAEQGAREFGNISEPVNFNDAFAGLEEPLVPPSPDEMAAPEPPGEDAPLTPDMLQTVADFQMDVATVADQTETDGPLAQVRDAVLNEGVPDALPEEDPFAAPAADAPAVFKPVPRPMVSEESVPISDEMLAPESSADLESLLGELAAPAAAPAAKPAAAEPMPALTKASAAALVSRSEAIEAEGLLLAEDLAPAVSALPPALRHSLPTLAPSKSELQQFIAAKSVAVQVSVRNIALQPDSAASKAVPEAVARKAQAVPLALAGGVLIAARAAANDAGAIKALREASKCRVKILEIPAEEVGMALDRAYGRPAAAAPKPAPAAKAEPAAPESNVGKTKSGFVIPIPPSLSRAAVEAAPPPPAPVPAPPPVAAPAAEEAGGTRKPNRANMAAAWQAQGGGRGAPQAPVGAPPPGQVKAPPPLVPAPPAPVAAAKDLDAELLDALAGIDEVALPDDSPAAILGLAVPPPPVGGVASPAPRKGAPEPAAPPEKVSKVSEVISALKIAPAPVTPAAKLPPAAVKPPPMVMPAPPPMVMPAPPPAAFAAPPPAVPAAPLVSDVNLSVFKLPGTGKPGDDGPKKVKPKKGNTAVLGKPGLQPAPPPVAETPAPAGPVVSDVNIAVFKIPTANSPSGKAAAAGPTPMMGAVPVPNLPMPGAKPKPMAPPPARAMGRPPVPPKPKPREDDMDSYGTGGETVAFLNEEQLEKFKDTAPQGGPDDSAAPRAQPFTFDGNTKKQDGNFEEF